MLRIPDLFPSSSMYSKVGTLFLVAAVAGCSVQGPVNGVRVTPLPLRTGPPFSTSGRLTKQQLDWYIQKAIEWMQTDRDPTPDGGYVVRPSLPFGKAIERGYPIEAVQSDDGEIVTVTIAQRIEPNSESWLMVKLDSHSGKVTTYSTQVLTKNV